MTLAAAGVLATSCQDYDPWDGDVAALQFRKDFVSRFGSIDPNHTWNFAEQQAVFVSPGTSQEVKIFAKTDGVYTLAGSFTGIDHAQWLYVDVVAGTKELSVVNGHRSIETFVGGEANFAATRAINLDGDEWIKISKNTDKSKYRFFTVDKAIEYERLLPAGNDNRGRLSENFFYVSRGPFMLYPQSWGAWDTDVIGIYYYDDNGQPVHVPIFELNGSDNEDKPTLYYQTDGGNYILNTDRIPYYKFKDYNGNRVNNGGTKDENCTKQCSHGYLVDIPEGMEFGLYIQNKTKSTFSYSQNILNGGSQKSTAVTFTMDGELYVAMEDVLNGGDNDLNDIVICFGPPTLPIIHDEDVLKWVLCYEDLGNTFDIDYNDVVIGVTNPVNDKVTVTPLAAGGTLASYVFFNGNALKTQYKDGSQMVDNPNDDGEIHGMFGMPKAKSGAYTPINVSNDQKTFDTGISRPVDVSSVGSNNYTLAAYSVGSTNGNLDGDGSLNKFVVKVVKSGDDATVENAKIDGQLIAPNSQSHVESGNNVPYVLCVPHRWRDHESLPFTYFRWSKELVPMTTSYATPGRSFAEWVADKTKAVDWYRHPNMTTTLTDRENHSYTPEPGTQNPEVNHNINYCPDYSYEKCLITRDEILTVSGSHEGNHTSDVSAYSLNIPKTDFRIVHHNETGADGEIHSEVIHDLTASPLLNIAFVATGLTQSGDNLTLTLSREKNGSKTQIGDPITFTYSSSKAISGTDANGADYYEVQLTGAQIPSWNDVDNLVVDVASHAKDIHLNSVWVRRSETDIETFNHTTLTSALNEANATVRVLMANPSTTEPNFLASGNLIRYSKTLAGMLYSAENIATATSGNNTTAQLTLIRANNESMKVIIKSTAADGTDKYLKNNGNRVAWEAITEETAKQTTECIFTIVPRSSDSDGSTGSCCTGIKTENLFRIKAYNNYYLNASGPKFATGPNDWSFWYIIKNIAGQH